MFPLLWSRWRCSVFILISDGMKCPPQLLHHRTTHIRHQTPPPPSSNQTLRTTSPALLRAPAQHHVLGSKPLLRSRIGSGKTPSSPWETGGKGAEGTETRRKTNAIKSHGFERRVRRFSETHNGKRMEILILGMRAGAGAGGADGENTSKKKKMKGKKDEVKRRC